MFANCLVLNASYKNSSRKRTILLSKHYKFEADYCRSKTYKTDYYFYTLLVFRCFFFLITSLSPFVFLSVPIN